MKIEKYKAIRATNYCTRCWKKDEPQNMYLNLFGKLICKKCFHELIIFYVRHGLKNNITKIYEINERFKHEI